MDRPKVNKSFEKKIADQPEDDILQLSSCPLHTTHNAFRNGTLELNVR